jgi:hypothetical protein
MLYSIVGELLQSGESNSVALSGTNKISERLEYGIDENYSMVNGLVCISCNYRFKRKFVERFKI